MADRVYLHVGTMKSATSYLQSLCQRNHQQLARQGVLWLPIGTQHASVNNMVLRSRLAIRPPKDWREAVAQIREHSGSVLLSNETMARRPPQRIRRLLKELKPADVHVIITARDLARVVPSYWQTTLRNQGVVPWATYAEWICSDDPPPEGKETADWFWDRQDLARIVATWMEQVGADRLTVVTVPPSGSPPEVTAERFLSVAGVDARKFKQPKAANESLSLRSAELLRQLNVRVQRDDKAEHKRVVRKELVNNALAHVGTSTDRYGLSPAQHAWVRDRSQQVVKALAQSGVSVVGDLDDLVPPTDPPSGLRDPAATSAEELLDAALDAMARLAEAQAKPGASGRGGQRDDDG